MALDDIIRSSVALAHSITTPLQVLVSHSQWISQNSFGDSIYAAAVNRLAIVEQRMRLHYLPSGKSVMTRAKVTFLHPIPINGAANRVEPIDPKDKIVLPDGTTGPIVDTEGLLDPDTNRPYLIECWIGAQ